MKASNRFLRRAAWCATCTGILAASASLPARGAEFAELAMAEDLTSLSLEDLMNVEITSVSKQKQRVGDAPAAIAVIGQEDIRRSGLGSIPELLRMAPGVQVARINATKYAISARGFNDLFANKLLVLMDGRAVYRPLFSGVYWENLDYVMEDLDRIEVIRGPGATLWGANAVNGVINIASKSADQTQGWLLSGRGGTEENLGSIRYGGKVDKETFYRVYGKYRYMDDSVFADGDRAHDDSSFPQAGFRIDRFATEADHFTLQGDLYYARHENRLSVDVFEPPFMRSFDDLIEAQGANLLGRWTHRVSDTSDFALQVYFDRALVEDAQLRYRQDTFDIDFQHRFALSDRQEIIWGVGYRLLNDELNGRMDISLDPKHRDDHLLSAFVQDRIVLVPERWSLFIGSKFEVNSYTGFEAQPGGRLLWTPNERNTVWGAISRAVRTPARFEEDARVTLQRGIDPGTGLPITLDVLGNGRVKSEEMLAYELGYRVQPTRDLTVDVAGFYNSYDRLRTLNFSPADIMFEPLPPPPHLLAPLRVANDAEGHSYGAEVAATWKVSDDWRLMAAYTYLEVEVEVGRGGDPFSESSYEESSPRHQLHIRSYYNVTRDLELNAGLFYVDHIRRDRIGPYVRLDANVAWQIRPELRLMVGVQNILDKQHPEFGRSLNDEATEVQRAFFAQLTWTF